MKPYPKYKDSGVEWIGNVPEHWKNVKLKYSADVVLGKMLVNDDKGGMFLKPYLRAANLQWFRVDVSDVKEMWFTENEMERLRLKKYDLLMSEGGEVGRTCIWNDELTECYLQNSVHKITFNKDNNAKYCLYQAYVMGQLGYFDSIVNRISIAHLTGEKVKEIFFIKPELSEQTAIAAFLDRKTAEIDSIISKKERLIELYEEEKAAVINHAVTKGLDPDAKMKDSGIEWLGEIPEHWEIVKVKRVFRLVTDRAPDNNDFELLSVYTDIGVRPRKELEARGNNATTTDGYWIVEKGDLVVNKLLAWMGAIGISEYNGVTSPAYDILRAKMSLEPKLFHYIFRTKAAQSEFKRWSRGIMEMRLRLYFDEFGGINISFPPVEEQTAIVQHIETKCGQIDAIISKFKRQIELLKEYRTALISEAVTGKIDVRENMPR